MRVKALIQSGEIPAGSIIDVEKEVYGNFFGIWRSHFGTFNVSISIKDCEIIKE
jgi:hypothetical protein